MNYNQNTNLGKHCRYSHYIENYYENNVILKHSITAALS